MSGIVAFFRARLNDDERVARAAASATLTEGEHPVWIQGEINYVDFDEPVVETHPDQAGVINDAQDTVVYDEGRDPALDTHIARHDPARVLREVKVKRAVLDAYETWLAEERAGHADYQAWLDGRGHNTDPPRRTVPEAAGDGLTLALRLLALPHADHPDFREEWRPEVSDGR